MCGETEVGEADWALGEGGPVAAGPKWRWPIATIGHPDTRLKELEDTAIKDPFSVSRDDIRDDSYKYVYSRFALADGDVAPGFADRWQSIASNIITGIGEFNAAISGLEAQGEWQGVTHDAAIGNVNASIVEPGAAGNGAGTMSILVDAFSRTIAATREAIVPKYQEFDSFLRSYPWQTDEIVHAWDEYAQNVMKTVYFPHILDIAAKNPGFTTGNTPQVGAPPDPNALGPGPFGGGGGGGAGPRGGGVPSLPRLPDGSIPSLSELASNRREGPLLPDGSNPSSTPGMPTSPAGLANGAGDAAKNALGQAGDAAKQALGKGQGPQGAPEGVLGLGPRGLNDLDGGMKKGGGGAAGAGSGGAGLKGMPSGRPAGAPDMAASRTQAATATPTASRAGVSGGAGAGMPGAGAPPPAAGPRGGDDGKEHKVSKALRTKKNGAEIMGGVEAVVAVIGDESAESVPDSAQP